MTEKQRSTLLTVIILGILAVGGMSYYYFIIAKEQIAQIDSQIQDRRDQVRELRATIAKYESFLKRQAEIEEAVEAIELATQRLPSGPNDERYLQLLSDFVAKTGISINAIRPDRPNDYDQYLELPNTLTGASRYSDFVQFLALAEQNATLFMRVSEFDLSNNPQAPFFHPFVLRLSTFVFKE